MSSLRILGIQQNPNPSTLLLLLIHKNTNQKNKNKTIRTPYQKLENPPQPQLPPANLPKTCVAARSMFSGIIFHLLFMNMLESFSNYSKH